MGKSAVVTGSARGIGRAIAERLAKDGMRVIVADNDGDEARATAEAIGDSARACRVAAITPARPGWRRARSST